MTWSQAWQVFFMLASAFFLARLVIGGAWRGFWLELYDFSTVVGWFLGIWGRWLWLRRRK